MKRLTVKEALQRIGEEVTVGGWVSYVRDLGGLRFFVLRDVTGQIQVTAKKGMEAWRAIGELGREYAVLVRGKVVESRIAKMGVELIPSEVKILAKAASPLPLDPTGKVPAELDTRLDNRFLDLRNPKTQAVFKIQARIVKAFRDFLTERGFIEIQPPCIIASASEGGADLFTVKYFERDAYLAQSPQLYKQMCAISLERVFMIVPVWRAEKFNRPTHLNEIRQMDVEMAFADDEDVMRVLEEVFAYIIRDVSENCEEELSLLGRELEVPKLPLRRVSYTEAVQLLREAGEEAEWGEDFSKAQEHRLWELVGEDAFFIKDWPKELKPFYAMPREDDPRLCRAFDLIHLGLEISSGTQRIHDPELLKKRLLECGLDPEDFKYYIRCFEYGAPPHAGWSIGLERLTMTITGMKNIRECCLFPRDRHRLVP